MKMLVVGARGLVGQGVLEAMADADCELIAVSRRAPDFATRAEFLSVDLTDRDACRGAFSGLSGVTHAVYAALRERPELIAGWRDEQQIATNLAMLRNVLDLVWRSVWPTVAAVFGMDVGEDAPASLVETMPRHAGLWDGMTRKYGLAGYGMDALVGSSWQFANAVFGLLGGQHTLLSTVKIRQAGFDDCIDTEVMLDGQLRRLQELRILPP